MRRDEYSQHTHTMSHAYAGNSNNTLALHGQQHTMKIHRHNLPHCAFSLSASSSYRWRPHPYPSPFSAAASPTKSAAMRRRRQRRESQGSDRERGQGRTGNKRPGVGGSWEKRGTRRNVWLLLLSDWFPSAVELLWHFVRSSGSSLLFIGATRLTSSTGGMRGTR